MFMEILYNHVLITFVPTHSNHMISLLLLFCRFSQVSEITHALKPKEAFVKVPVHFMSFIRNMMTQCQASDRGIPCGLPCDKDRGLNAHICKKHKSTTPFSHRLSAVLKDVDGKFLVILFSKTQSLFFISL